MASGRGRKSRRRLLLLGLLGPRLLGLGFLRLGLVATLFAGLLGAEGPVTQVTVFEAAMAPMIGASIVAMDHNLDPPLVTLMLGVGIPLSFLTLPAWWYLLTLI